MNWLRLYTDVLDKHKVQTLPGELFKAWINFLLIARQHEGLLPPLREIAFRLHVDDDIAEGWLLSLTHRRLIDETPDGFRPHDWEQYQYDSDSSKERVRKFRAKVQAEKKRNVTETLLKRHRAEQNRIDIRPSGLIQKPAAETNPPSLVEAARLLIAAFPGTGGLSGAPDSVLAGDCLDLAGGSLEELGRGLRALMVASKRPSLSWAWFRTVLPTYLRPAKRGVKREERRA